VIELGLQDVVTMHGAQNGAFIRQLIDQAHLALLASVTVEVTRKGKGWCYRRRKRRIAGGGDPTWSLAGRDDAGPVGVTGAERDVEALADALNHLIGHS